MARIAAAVCVALAAIIGFVFQDDPYRLRDTFMPADQLALDHRDSPYSHVTWVVSRSNNYAQLRFYDKVEGGVCLEPRWDDLARHPELAHLAMPADYPWDSASVGKEWPKDVAKPNPGTLSNTRYICMYPMGILLNRPLMQAAGEDWRKVDPDILIVGLGSGVGVAMLAHHFPEASITVVDIDEVVNDMVRDHYPLLKWLEQDAPPTASGKPRLRLVANDARQYIKYPQLRHEDNYDLVILDAYTSGSTIPPHLMTSEFYGEVADVLDDGGIVLSNIIGSYTGAKHLILGGAMHSMQDCGLHEIFNFPIHYYEEGQKEPKFETIDQSYARNNVVLASKSALDPSNNAQGWAAIDRFIAAGHPYAEFKANRHTSALVSLVTDSEYTSAKASLLTPDGTAIDEDLLRALIENYRGQPWDDRGLRIRDNALIERTIAAVRRHASATDQAIPRGWKAERADMMIVHFTDWVVHARTNFQASATIARMLDSPRVYTHSGTVLIGTPDGNRENAVIKDAPLFTDAAPNADIYNH